ncbi:MAG: hypothetical protein ACK4UU_09740, partial [Fimbriimonadales bacterium]
MSNQSHAFRWEDYVMLDLGTLGGANSRAYGISANGAFIVGSAQDTEGNWRAFRWSDSNGMENLGSLGGNEIRTYGVTNDGTVVVGMARNTAGEWRAFRWTPEGGTQDLNQVYARLLSGNAVLVGAYAISPDGRYIVGWGVQPSGGYRAFLLDTRCINHNGDVDENGCVDDADLLAILFAFGEQGEVLGRIDVNCDGIVDDADLLQVL